jgi:hypothetical protein
VREWQREGVTMGGGGQREEEEEEEEEEVEEVEEDRNQGLLKVERWNGVGRSLSLSRCRYSLPPL